MARSICGSVGEPGSLTGVTGAVAVAGASAAAIASPSWDKSVTVVDFSSAGAAVSASGAASSSRGQADVEKLEQDLSDRLGAAVSIEHDAKGKGRLIVRFNSLDEFEGILAHLK